MRHIFLSFSPKDKQYMMTLRENLIRVGYRPWVDPAPRPGSDWRFDIDDAIRSSDAVMVVVTPTAAQSTYVTYEWSLALGRGIPVVPIIFEAAKMHPRLRTMEHYDVTGFRDPQQFWEYFMREMQRKLTIQPEPDAPSQLAEPAPVQQQASASPPRQEPPPAYTRSIMPTHPGYYIVVRRGPHLNAMYQLEKDIVSLGRDKNNDITIDDPEVSRHHLRLMREDSGYSVDDLDSTNGTRIDGGPRIENPVPLQPGQALMLGDAIILSYEEVPA